MKVKTPRSTPGRAGLLLAALIGVALLGSSAEAAGLKTVSEVFAVAGVLLVLALLCLIAYGLLKFVADRYNRRHDQRRALESQREAVDARQNRARLYSAGHRRGALPYRLNSPPGWPEPPTDWVPQPGWEPDRSWPKSPQGWQLWQRTQPRPRHQPRSPWDPHPGVTQMADEFDEQTLRGDLSKPGAAAPLSVQVMQFQVKALDSRVKFDAEADEVRGRSRWHPVEWTYRHAAVAVVDLGQAVTDRLLLDEQPREPADIDADEVVRLWRNFAGWVDEYVDAMQECYLTSRAPGRNERGSVDLYDHAATEVLLDPGPAAWQQAEHLAAAALVRLGFDDAQVTGGGTDRGLDVAGKAIAAQVKYTNAAIGRPLIQQLVGAAGDRQTAFFSRAGFTEHAVEEANQRGMALFELKLPSTVRPRNLFAQQLADI